MGDYIPWATRWLRESARVLLYGSPEKSWVSRTVVVLEDELQLRMVQHLTLAYSQGGDAWLTGMSRYAVRTEHLVWFEKPDGPRTFNPAEVTDKYAPHEKRVALAKGRGRVTEAALDRGRPPTTCISVSRENSRSRERRYGRRPSMKPLPLCQRLVRAHTNAGDPFAGSGLELVAAAKLGRRVIAFEKEEEYVQLVRRRADGHGIRLQ